MQTGKTNIFTRNVSVFAKATDTVPIATATILQAVTSRKIISKVGEYRRTGDKALKLSIPCFTPSGTFSERRDGALTGHSGVICIDVDGKDNTRVSNFRDLKKLISQIPCVAYCGLSVGGKGYFLLIPVKYPNRHREQFKACCEDFERCGIVADRSCINISRLRFMSYDPEAYLNREAAVYTRIYEGKKEAPEYNRVYDGSTGNDMERLISEIQGRRIDITGNYRQWLEIGAAIAGGYGETGRGYFHAVSRYSTKYDRKAADRKYSDCMKMRNFNIGTLYYYAKQYGIIVHQKSVQ
ncbi:MAG: PriCT-2 domain-containing protein [Prevotella sp.]|jgi:hypothetical protein|nr:PriCT-2 domain-containing protein [Prevotella sp.]